MNKFIFILGLSILILILIFWELHIEFLDVRLNYLSKIVFYFSFPLIFLPIILSGKPKSLWVRVPIIFLAALCLWIFLIPLTCNLLDAKDIFRKNVDIAYEKIHEIRVGNKFFTCFRSDMGATTDTGIHIRRESRFLCFVKYEMLISVYHAYDAQFYNNNNEWFAKINNRDEPLELK